MCWGAVLQSGDVTKDGDATMSDDIVDGSRLVSADISELQTNCLHEIFSILQTP